MSKTKASYKEYLERASEKHGVPVAILSKILDIEKEKQYMKRRHNIYSDLRKILLDEVRDET